MLAILLPLLAGAQSFVSNGIHYEVIYKTNNVKVTPEYRFDDYSSYSPVSSGYRYVYKSQWNEDDEQYDLGYVENPTYSGVVVIPSTVSYNGVEYTVSEIDNQAFAVSDITNITLPSTITKIGNDAFYQCKNLQTFEAPIYRSVESIGYRAFTDCSSMKEIIIPSSVGSIGHSSFWHCTGKLTVYNSTVMSSDGIYPFRNSDFNEVIINSDVPDGPASSMYGVFSDCEKLEKVTLSERVMTVGTYAFANCKKLTTIEFVDIKSIGNSAFMNCSSLTTLDLPQVRIEDNAFKGCSKLATVTSKSPYIESLNAFPEGIEMHVIKALEEGYNRISNGRHQIIGDIELPNNMIVYYTDKEQKIYDLKSGEQHRYGTDSEPWKHIFGNKTGVILFQHDITIIPMNTFEYRPFTEVFLPNSIKTIDDWAFYSCSNMTTVHLPESLSILGSGAFTRCIALTSIEIPESVKEIQNSTFSGCTSLTSVKMSNDITSIAESAFRYCTSLININAPAPRANARRKVRATAGIYLPAGLNTLGKNAFSECTLITTIEIPEGVEIIEDLTFAGCSALNHITLPKTVNEIGARAFAYCDALTSLTCNAVTPPSYYQTAFQDLNKENVVLTVPEESKSLYQADTEWSGFVYAGDKETITLGASNYATYCTNVNLDFTNVNGLKAYMITGYDASKNALTITNVDYVTAGEGFLLKGTAGQSYDVPTSNQGGIGANYMMGTTKALTINPTDGDHTNYILTKNSEGVIGFYRFTGTVNMPAYKAWLQVPTGSISSSAKGFSLMIDEDENVTAISDIKPATTGRGNLFDLQGRRLNVVPSNGVYIQNGKKVIK